MGQRLPRRVGIETWNDGSQYKGHFKNGKKEGYGEYIWSNGSKYVGNWKNNTEEGQENIYGLIKIVMKDMLKIMLYKEKAIIDGQMEEIMQENLIKGKSMDQEDIYGLMEEFMLDFGKMESNMVQDVIKKVMNFKCLVLG